MKKKVLVGLGVIIGLVFIGRGITHAESLEEALKAYLQDPKLDFLGMNYDKMFFKLLEGEDPTILDKIKAIPQDIKTIPLQIKASWKVVNQEPNRFIYLNLAGLGGLKKFMGAKEFNQLVERFLKAVIR